MIEILQKFIAIDYAWILITLASFLLFQFLAKRFNNSILFNPTLGSMLIILALMYFLNADYNGYLEHTKIIFLLLNLTIVSLAVPLYQNRVKIRKYWKAIFASLALTNLLSITITYIYVDYFDIKSSFLPALLGKSATSPVNMAISELFSLNISIAAIFSVTTGIIIAIIGPSILRWIKEKDDAAKGFSIGVSGHGIAVAEMVKEGEMVLSFAALGLILNGIVTAIIIPLLLNYFYF